MDYSIKHVSLSVNDRHNGLGMSDIIISYDLHINDTTYAGVRLWVNRIFDTQIHLTLMGHPELDNFLKSLKRNISRQLAMEIRHREEFIHLADDYFCHHTIVHTEHEPNQMAMNF